ncbi:MATE family efflux transporter [Haloimpatiens sp. FM7330]|uniref:MATE family efflux transporter n=1 Tax=Haloimpatiens sp. FM7330 TaxID=3298610 RepID=UPI00363BDB5C
MLKKDLKDKDVDLTQGSITKNLLRMSLPTMLGFLFQTAYDLVDIMWIGRISAKAIAAVTIFTTIFWTVDILNEIIGTSSVSLISQSYGSGDMEKTQVAIEQTLTFKAFVAVIAAIIMLIILKPLLRIFSTDPQVLKQALDYGYIRIFFLPIMFSSFSVNTAFRCIGQAGKPMKIMIIASITNIILDPIFMFDKITIPIFGITKVSIPGFNLGIFGAALATVISVTLAFSIGFFIFITGREKIKISIKGLFKLNWPVDKKLLTIGLPSGFEMLTRNLANVFTLRFVKVYGTAAIAAMGIGGKLFNFAFMPLVGLSMGGSAIVGQCLGKKNIDRAKETSKKASLMGAITMLVVSGFAIAFSKYIMKIFTNDIEVISIGVPMIRISISGLIVIAIAMGFGTAFSGSGYNIPFFVSSLISRWLVQLPVLFLITVIYKVNIKWIWIVFLVVDFMEFLVLSIFYKKGKWKKKTV